MMLYLVIDEDGCLRNIMPSQESAEKFIANHGDIDTWTVELEEAC